MKGNSYLTHTDLLMGRLGLRSKENSSSSSSLVPKISASSWDELGWEEVPGERGGARLATPSFPFK